MSITNNGYQTRVNNCLKENEIEFGELQYISKRELFRWRNLGKKSIEYIENRLSSMGLSLGEYSLSEYKSLKELGLLHKENLDDAIRHYISDHFVFDVNGAATTKDNDGSHLNIFDLVDMARYFAYWNR